MKVSGQQSALGFFALTSTHHLTKNKMRFYIKEIHMLKETERLILALHQIK